MGNKKTNQEQVAEDVMNILMSINVGANIQAG